MAKRPGKGAKRPTKLTSNFKGQGAMIGGIVAGEMDRHHKRMHGRMHGKRGR